MADNDPGLPHVDIAGYLLHALPPEESESFRIHLRTCARCARELEELSELPTLLGQAASSPPPSLPNRLEERVFEALKRETSGRRPAMERVSGWSGWRWNRPVWATVAAVAAILLALGAIHLLPAANQTPPETIHLVAVDGSTAHGTARLQRTASGATIDLTIERLRAPAAGQVYVCWLRTADNSDQVAIGRFKTAGPAAKRWRWTTTADTSRYSRMGVTQESESDPSPPTGRPVLKSTA